MVYSFFSELECLYKFRSVTSSTGALQARSKYLRFSTEIALYLGGGILWRTPHSLLYKDIGCIAVHRIYIYRMS